MRSGSATMTESNSSPLASVTPMTATGASRASAPLARAAPGETTTVPGTAAAIRSPRVVSSASGTTTATLPPSSVSALTRAGSAESGAAHGRASTSRTESGARRAGSMVARTRAATAISSTGVR